MDHATGYLRFLAALALSALVGGTTFASGQAAPGASAGSDIRVIDPNTGGARIAENRAQPQVDLPPLPGDQIASRAPAAVPKISNPVVQPASEPQAASDDPFVVKSILPIEGSIRYGEWHWDESRAPKRGKLVMTVDLDARVISVFRDGHEIGTAVTLLGTQKHPTPLGAFPILTKEKDNVSEKYDNAPMPWTLRLTWDGIAIHGSPVVNGYASHGCIGVPDPFAEKLFSIANRGDTVIITRGEMIGIGDKIVG